VYFARIARDIHIYLLKLYYCPNHKSFNSIKILRIPNTEELVLRSEMFLFAKYQINFVLFLQRRATFHIKYYVVHYQFQV
jgi:hypothetical protein